MERKFRGYTNWPEYVGLSDFAQFNEKGQLVSFYFDTVGGVPGKVCIVEKSEFFLKRTVYKQFLNVNFTGGIDFP